MKPFLLVAAALSLISNAAYAWSEHHLITDAILKDARSLEGARANLDVVPFHVLLSALGNQDQPGKTAALKFNEEHKLKKNYVFKFFYPDKVQEAKSEQPGDVVSIKYVLSKYSDEPDWGMDREVFDDYPEEWSDDYNAMGGRKNIESQAFRHMYWQAETLRNPIITWKWPNRGKPMGQAPYRAAMFIGLARKARAVGMNYWSVRFVANAIHYLEDVSQPFHATQLQTKEFLLAPFESPHGMTAAEFTNGIGRNSTRAATFMRYQRMVTNVVSYYHQSFEDYIGYIMGQEASSAEAQQFRSALERDASSVEQALRNAAATRNTAVLVKAMASSSAGKAPLAAKTARSFFPSMEGFWKLPEVQKQDALLAPKHQSLRLDSFFTTLYLSKDSPWWPETIENGRRSTAEKEKYFAAVREIFGQLGFAVRALVASEISE